MSSRIVSWFLSMVFMVVVSVRVVRAVRES